MKKNTFDTLDSVGAYPKRNVRTTLSPFQGPAVVTMKEMRKSPEDMIRQHGVQFCEKSKAKEGAQCPSINFTRHYRRSQANIHGSTERKSVQNNAGALQLQLRHFLLLLKPRCMNFARSPLLISHYGESGSQPSRGVLGVHSSAWRHWKGIWCTGSSRSHSTLTGVICEYRGNSDGSFDPVLSRRAIVGRQR